MPKRKYWLQRKNLDWHGEKEVREKRFAHASARVHGGLYSRKNGERGMGLSGVIGKKKRVMQKFLAKIHLQGVCRPGRKKMRQAGLNGGLSSNKLSRKGIDCREVRA